MNPLFAINGVLPAHAMRRDNIAASIMSLFGGGNDESVDVSGSTDSVEKSAASTKKRRSLLLATQGGLAGEELSSGSTRRDTLFGNA